MDSFRKSNDTHAILDKEKEVIFIEREGKCYKCKKDFTIKKEISPEKFKTISDKTKEKKSRYESIFFNAESQNLDKKILVFQEESQTCNA